jgi:hypothetical protein
MYKDTTMEDITYVDNNASVDYHYVNYVSINSGSRIDAAKIIVNGVIGIIDDTMSACESDSNMAECYYNVRVENLSVTPKYTGHKPENTGLANNPVQYKNGSLINIRVKLKSFVENNSFSMSYKGVNFICYKDGDMYANCSGTVTSGTNIAVSITDSSATVEGANQFIYIKEGYESHSILDETPTIPGIQLVEAYLNGNFDEVVGIIDNNTSSSHVAYNIVYYITTYMVDKAGNRSEDVRVLHVTNNTTSGAVITSDDGTNAAVVLQGEKFSLPSFTGFIIDYDRNTITDMDDFTLVYEYNGQVVDEIDTNLVGTYKVYAHANVKGKDVRMLVYTIDIQDGYVEVININSNYALPIIILMIYLLLACVMVFILRKKKRI